MRTNSKHYGGDNIVQHLANDDHDHDGDDDGDDFLNFV
jgi:hypothetical protein